MKKQQQAKRASSTMAGKKFYNDAFKEIFGNMDFVKSLLQDFIGEDWVQLIDFTGMKEIKSDFTGILDKQRESDLLLEFPLNKKSKDYVFILMEFQSTYKKMGLRVMEYLFRAYKGTVKAQAWS